MKEEGDFTEIRTMNPERYVHTYVTADPCVLFRFLALFLGAHGLLELHALGDIIFVYISLRDSSTGSR